MTLSDDDGTARPTLGADDLVRQLGHYLPEVRVRATTLAKVGSPQLRVQDAMLALTTARAAVTDGADGVVVIQGTDTLEETAFLLDLLWEHPEPLILTGAMRYADDAGAEGLGNLVASVRVAFDPELRGNGVLAVMNDEVHLAQQVVKRDSTALQAFTSASWGPIARVVEGRLHVAYRRSGPRVPLPDPTPGPVAIPLLIAAYDDDGAAIDAIIALRPRGIVIAGMGSGHVPVPMADAAERAVQAGIPVVFATRTGAGTTTTATYGYPGSEADLLRRGLIGAGWLDPLKARLLLHVLVSTGLGPDQIRAEFASRGY